jgi:hypothetical protein
MEVEIHCMKLEEVFILIVLVVVHKMPLMAGCRSSVDSYCYEAFMLVGIFDSGFLKS